MALHRHPAWLGALVALTLGLSGAMSRTERGQVPTTDDGRFPALGAGSVAAFPFGAGGSMSARTGESTQGPVRWLDSVPDLPNAILALGDEPVPHALDRLAALARRGDVRAAADAYEIAQFCATSGMSRGALLSLPVAASPEVRDRLQSGVEDHARICQYATPAQLNERFADIRIAAEGGVPGAAEKLLDTGMQGEPARDGLDDPAAKEWTERTVALVLRDAKGGDVGALTALASIYQAGGGVDRDPARALTYQLAAVEIMKAQSQQYSPFEIALQQEFAKRDEASVERNEVDAARKAASDLFTDCCSEMRN